MEKQDEKKLLTTLKSIDGTLKRIEQLLAVSHDMIGEKYDSTPGNNTVCFKKDFRTSADNGAFLEIKEY